MRIFTLAILILGLLMAFFRLAPADPAQWYRDPAQAVTDRGGFQTSRFYPEAPTALLIRLNALALATPRTILYAGDPQSGRITWVTRSLIMGFPDYTTAGVSQTENGTRLDIHARLRFGVFDFGMNAQRINLWLQNL